MAWCSEAAMTMATRPCHSLARKCISSSAFRVRIVPAQFRRQSSLSNDGIARLLSKPTWSVRSLLPPSNTPTNAEAQRSSQSPPVPEVTSKHLHPILRVSALPAPRDDAEEARMLETLSSQLHFVRSTQSVDTTGVEPLRSVRDETSDGDKVRTVGLAETRDALGREEIVGKHHMRLKRRQTADKDEEIKKAEDWNVLGSAERKVGKFFVVEGAPREE